MFVTRGPANCEYQMIKRDRVALSNETINELRSEILGFLGTRGCGQPMVLRICVFDDLKLFESFKAPVLGGRG